MVFSSLLFLFLFLPAVLALYYVSPWRIKNLILFLSSLVFYAWGEPVYIVIMLLSTITDYSFGLLLSRPKLTAVQRKWIVVSSVIINLGLLSYFKYADFLIQNINGLLGTHIPLTDLPLPIGISFYTFQSMSYIIDVYRGTTKAQRNWIDFGTFVALFPQLVAGPIVQYNTIAGQLRERSVDIPMFAEGVRRFIIGLAKKVLLANNIGMLWHTISSSNLDSLPAFTAWLGIIAFAFQIYFDFSGYSDMAIGLGLMFGFRFNENFNKPYISQSITDFWRRWHISLSSWFRDYVYIPLGGNRRGLSVQVRNILIVWLLTGIWHGASWNFLLWGLYFGVILIFEKWWGLTLLSRLPRWTRHLYAVVLILIGWVLFAFEELPLVIGYLQAMLGFNGQPLWNNTTLYFTYTNAILLVVLTFASTPVKLSKRMDSRSVPALVWYGVLLFLSVAYLVDATFNPFLYFRF
ncbi:MULTISPECIES: MBOAT family O-acyltransferase [Paenibacillus]|uniref:MBOAT family O-acyltransferase n=1 Tax=Paenibacillus TaxID=44249 RepID=UPI00096D64FC|nr:MBOAT family O-acyltransferase [Paenibacillus odorifer]OMC63631.1 transcriptional regulator [Paenibacillus odorifer]OMD93632.1 transcriptional regulator [Paenibacillus odorifer]OME01046.1 transcriptional regulator [Paenibacillus odorifer]